ncbi:MAG TPA: endonuclease III [Terriglobales bacterium]|nr:endonuclease III [Terriglobales bacterium]
MTRSQLATQKLMLRIIERKFPVNVWKAGSPFETLVGTILSQNTNDRNSEAAMRRLRKRYRITPKVLARARLNDLIRCIKSAGLYTLKGPRIIQVAQIIQEQYGGRLSPLLNLPYGEAKEKLMNLPGVGPKTADILLAFVAKNPIIPVDTHISRVTKRLGIAKQNANYEQTRVPLENLIPPSKRVRVHLSIIAFGREICRAPRPRCPICPVNKWCPSSTV